MRGELEEVFRSLMPQKELGLYSERTGDPPEVLCQESDVTWVAFQKTHHCFRVEDAWG
jgi:hypothetical protein